MTAQITSTCVIALTNIISAITLCKYTHTVDIQSDNVTNVTRTDILEIHVYDIGYQTGTLLNTWNIVVASHNS